MKIIEGNLALKGDEKIAIINARFNHIITDRLVEGARDAFLRHGGDEKNLSLIWCRARLRYRWRLKRR